MRFRIVVAAGLTAGLVAVTASAQAPSAAWQDDYRHGRVRYADRGVSLQRATEVSAEEALANLPFLPGDRVWTDSQGRAEFQFPDGTVVRLDSRSKLDYAGHEEGEQERITLRLWSGSVIVRVRTRSFARFEVETPAGMVQALDRGIVRVDVDSGETRVSVYAGEAALDDGRRQVRLAAGERTFARWGGEAEEPRRFDPGENDEFARWDGMRESDDRWAATSSEHLPSELGAYAGEFESNGNWRYEGTAGGYVWFPHVAVGWQPYSNGYWAWTPYGWTWIPNESWGWAPFHYGRWDYSASLGWYWMPGRHWGPAWVDWAVGGGYVGWCPLGRHDRPVSPWGYHGYGVARGQVGGPDAWHLVRQPHLGVRNLGPYLVKAGQVDTAAVHASDSVLLRPTRDARDLSQDRAVPRTISRRLTPGDFVRELGTDNKTTIPAPWTRGYGPPPAGVEGARYGTPRRTDGTSEDKPSRGWNGNPGTGSADERRQGSTPGNEVGSAPATNPSGSTAPPKSARPSPWYVPRPTDDGGTDRQRGGNAGGSRGADRTAPGAVDRPRHEGSAGDGGGSDRSGGSHGSGVSSGQNHGESGSGGHPRSGSSGGSGGSQPHGSGGGTSSAGGAHPKSSGGSSGSSSKPSGNSSGNNNHSSTRPRG